MNANQINPFALVWASYAAQNPYIDKRPKAPKFRPLPPSAFPLWGRNRRKNRTQYFLLWEGKREEP